LEVVIMQTRTWPYGTRKVGTVSSVDNLRNHRIVFITSEDEGYFLLGEPADVRVGQTVTFEFCKGGPMGGYWRIVT
jgi:hypothetical protein